MIALTPVEIGIIVSLVVLLILVYMVNTSIGNNEAADQSAIAVQTAKIVAISASTSQQIQVIQASQASQSTQAAQIAQVVKVSQADIAAAQTTIQGIQAAQAAQAKLNASIQVTQTNQAAISAQSNTDILAAQNSIQSLKTGQTAQAATSAQSNTAITAAQNFIQSLQIAQTSQAAAAAQANTAIASAQNSIQSLQTNQKAQDSASAQSNTAITAAQNSIKTIQTNQTAQASSEAQANAAITSAQNSIQTLQTAQTLQTQVASAIQATQANQSSLTSQATTASASAIAASVAANASSQAIAAAVATQNASVNTAIAAIQADATARNAQAAAASASAAAAGSASLAYTSVASIQAKLTAQNADASANLASITTAQNTVTNQAAQIVAAFAKQVSDRTAQSVSASKYPPGLLATYIAKYEGRIVRCAATGAMYYIENGFKRYINSTSNILTGTINKVNVSCDFIALIPDGIAYASQTISGNNGSVTCDEFCTGTWGRDQIGTSKGFTGAKASTSFISNGNCGCTLTNDINWMWPANATGNSGVITPGIPFLKIPSRTTFNSCDTYCKTGAQSQLSSIWSNVMGAKVDPSSSSAQETCSCKATTDPAYMWSMYA